jgi:hypothetical protein
MFPRFVEEGVLSSEFPKSYLRIEPPASVVKKEYQFTPSKTGVDAIGPVIADPIVLSNGGLLKFPGQKSQKYLELKVSNGDGLILLFWQ